MCLVSKRLPYCLIASLFFLATTFVQAQKLTKEEHDKKIAALSEKEKVEYIINNYCALYSSDFENALKLTFQAAVISRQNNWRDKETYAEMYQLIGHEVEINVIVEDNGDGFDTKVLQAGPGNGWKNIRSRLNLLKGSVEIDSQSGRPGTTLIIRVPLHILYKAGEPASVEV